MSTNHKLPTLTVLHLDDDPFELERVQHALEKHALECVFRVKSVDTVAAFKAELVRSPGPDIVILDIHVDQDQTTGIQLADYTRGMQANAIILMCSTADDSATIAECLSSAADDFISKLSDKGELSLRVFNSYRLATLKHGAVTAAAPGPNPRASSRPVGSTMARIAQRMPLILGSAITAVFIRGESGTGKEVVADLLGASLPPGTPFLKVNCGAIAPTLLESELFGHVKGAFTGALTDKRGLLEAASGGWLFLDEVATLSPSAQVALLRALENQELLRVGATKPVTINLRVLSATNEPLEQLVQAGKFRGDLWQRLRETEISLPPLRDRPDEIKPLVEHFCRTMPGGPYQVSGPVLEVLTHVGWRDGNVRELRNCLRAMTEMHIDRLLTPLAVPERIWDELGEKPVAAAGTGAGAPPEATKSAAVAAPANSPIVLPWTDDAAPNFDQLSDLLLLEMTRKLALQSGRLSLRSLSQAIGLSRSTLSGRLKGLVHRNVITLPELARLVGISDS